MREMVSLSSPDDSTSPAGSPPTGPFVQAAPYVARWRAPLAALLLVIFMVSAGLAVPAVWARNQLLDTDRFVRTISPLGDNAAFQDALANQLSRGITASVVSSDIVGDNDGVIGAIFPAIAATATDTFVSNFVHSSRFPSLWDTTARASHHGFVALMEGTDSPFLDSSNGQISVDLTPVALAVVDDLAARGIPVSLPQDALRFVIFESSALKDMQTFTKILDELAIILTIVALASLIGYILLAPNRVGAIFVAGLGLAISMLAVLLFLLLMRWFYLRGLSESVDRSAAMATFDILTNYLRLALRLLGLGGLIIAGIVYLAFRGNVTIEEEGETSRTISARWPLLGKIETAIATNRLAAAGIWLAIATAVLLLRNWTDPGWIVVLLTITVAGVVLIRRAKSVPLAMLEAASSAYDAPFPRQLSTSLQQIADLKAQGLLSDDEFDRAKALILAGN
ncbi:MAG: SHOCT domain-containing protein [Thermomicrobiales bacterium]